MSARYQEAIRKELGEILDKLDAVPCDAFAERSDLHARKNQLSQKLSELHGESSREITERWARRAGTKEDPQNQVEQVIPSPGGGEGGSWA